MTRDPERLLSAASGADALERELLASLKRDAAPADARRLVWQGVAAALAAGVPASVAAAAGTGMAAAASGATLAPAAGSSGTLAAGTSAKALALLVAKWAVVAAVGAGAVSGAMWAMERSKRGAVDAHPPPTAAAAAAPAREPAAPPPPMAAEEEIAPPALPLARAATRAQRRETDSLAAESALLRTARADLRRGDLAHAQRALQRLKQQFPHGGLNQERDVLQIELASARGDEAAAHLAAERFLQAYPESPHAARVRAIVAAP